MAISLGRATPITLDDGAIFRAARHHHLLRRHIYYMSQRHILCLLLSARALMMMPLSARAPSRDNIRRQRHTADTQWRLLAFWRRMISPPCNEGKIIQNDFPAWLVSAAYAEFQALPPSAPCEEVARGRCPKHAQEPADDAGQLHCRLLPRRRWRFMREHAPMAASATLHTPI